MKDSYSKGIVILNYNTEEDTVKCVDSIFVNTEDIKNTKIYIVDNCSPDGSGVRLKERYRNRDGISVIISDKNGGFSYGNNFGIRQAIADGCKYVFLLNSDIYLLNDAIGIMSKTLDENTEIYAVGPRIYDADNNDIQFARKALTYKSHMMERLPFLGDRQIRRYSYEKSSVSGAQVFYYKTSKESRELAGQIMNSINTNVCTDSNRKIKPNNSYYMLKNTKCPIALVECGFLSNDEEAVLLNSEQYQDEIAKAIYQGIEEYIGKKHKL